MTPRLQRLIAAVGVVMLGGITYEVFRARPNAEWADFLDAGISDICASAHIECQVRNFCQDLPDGGRRPRYGTIELKGYVCPHVIELPDGGDFDAGSALLMRLPQAEQTFTRRDGGTYSAIADCFDVMGPVDSACRFVEDAGLCTDPTACDDTGGARPWKLAADRCVCWDPSAGPCRIRGLDGGPQQIPVGATEAAPALGTGCVRKPCTEAAGEQGQSWPSACPAQ